MLAAEPPTASLHLRHSGRKPLQPKPNLFNFANHHQHDPPNSNSINKPAQQIPVSSSSVIDSNSNKENINPNTKQNTNTNMNVQLIDASLAQELSAVKQKLERLKSDKDKTQDLLQQRDRVLEVQMTELLHRGEFQKELEIEVDRLYRLKQLKLACVKTSPILSLREKEMEKKNKESQPELIVNEEKTEESKEELLDESSTTESPTMSFESSSASTSASIAAKSTATSKTLPISLRLNLESDFG